MDSVEDIKRLPGLEPHPAEGGFFAETYRAAESLPADALPERYGAARNISTAIYYLLTPDSFSAMHRLASDEVFHFYLGDPVEILRLHPGGHSDIAALGSDVAAGMRPQVVVPAGVWQGSRLRSGGRYALLGTTVAPGFAFDDYEHGSRDGLAAAYPGFADQVRALTRE